MGDKEACEECKLKCSFIHGDKNGPSPSVTTFHKILSGDRDFSKDLCLPQTVSQTIPGLVAGKIYFLEDSNNQVWKVILFTKDGQLAFGKGWDKFFADHGLREGYTLAFHYMVSHFVVQIIDETGIEKLEFPIVNGYKRKRSEFDDSCNAVGECQKVSNTTTEKQENSLKLNSEENQTFNGNEAHEVSKDVKTEPVVLVIDDSETESNELLDVTKHTQENIQDASPYCMGQLNRIKRLKFECQNEPKDRKDLLRGSQFFNLLGVKNTKDCPAALVGCFCRIYDENNKKFVIKDGVSISFCANEVANALQIKNSGKLKEQIKLKGKEPGQFCINCFPSFVDDLKLKWGG